VPTYQYVCTVCGDDLEVVQKFSDDPLTTHDACGGKLRKVFAPVGIVFKGSGFYRTDSRNGSSSSTAVANSNSSDKTDKTDKSEKSTTVTTDSKSDSPTASGTSAPAGTSSSSSKVA
jgi:putative FmdB family regulatory protein